MKNKKKPFISVVTVVFQGAKTLERAIKSIVNQTYGDFEYVLVDGGSTDGTLDIIKKYSKKIDCWVSEPDKGIFDAMSKVVKLAQGNYIYFLLADDYLLNPNILEKIAKDLKNHQPLIAYGQVIFPIEDYGYMIWPTKKVSLKDIRRGQTLPQQGLFIKRELMLEVGLYDQGYTVSGDRDLLCKCVKISGEPVFLNYPIAFFEAGGKSSGFNVNETARVIYTNFGLLNTIIFYLTYSPLIIMRYFLGRYGIFRKYILRFLMISYKLFFSQFYPFTIIEDKRKISLSLISTDFSQ